MDLLSSEIDYATTKLKSALISALLPKTKRERFFNRIGCFAMGHNRTFFGYCTDCGKKL